jgi:hypothetical protein
MSVSPELSTAATVGPQACIILCKGNCVNVAVGSESTTCVCNWSDQHHKLAP